MAKYYAPDVPLVQEALRVLKFWNLLIVWAGWRWPVGDEGGLVEALAEMAAGSEKGGLALPSEERRVSLPLALLQIDEQFKRSCPFWKPPETHEKNGKPIGWFRTQHWSHPSVRTRKCRTVSGWGLTLLAWALVEESQAAGRSFMSSADSEICVSVWEFLASLDLEKRTLVEKAERQQSEGRSLGDSERYWKIHRNEPQTGETSSRPPLCVQDPYTKSNVFGKFECWSDLREWASRTVRFFREWARLASPGDAAESKESAETSWLVETLARLTATSLQPFEYLAYVCRFPYSPVLQFASLYGADHAPDLSVEILFSMKGNDLLQWVCDGPLASKDSIAPRFPESHEEWMAFVEWSKDWKETLVKQEKLLCCDGPYHGRNVWELLQRENIRKWHFETVQPQGRHLLEQLAEL
uniref:Uncharacterized protein n=1 Tax=Chromera velia CCMP2878 TaxID=1169474 RepID=A0A0G4FCB7_9ALVE|eukprot:Cvel_16305.t1-p1 / transcript=Cvel_16305.t1 / gene=Cvel_16305 / organism=Chromera_velia_CCMP2878 / gene_product=hypothetical protein / transcript_product=hypothetical protein / location=Cvel_scaffold1251:28033-29262(-) / protein_length=410 / sequence_SO=supercontig / SO=protein_coding / is_pseudo=false